MPRRSPKRPVRAVKAIRPRITGKQWAAIEGAYRHPIAKVRQAIHDGLREYAVLWRAEFGGVPIKAADKHLADIREHTKALLAALTSEGDTALLTHDWIEQADVDLDRLRGLLIVLGHVCNQLPVLRPHKEGEAWGAWVRGLTAICEEHHLPTEARQDPDARFAPSPFVAFVEKLQEFLPPQLRRHTHSLLALASAINSARAVADKTREPNL